MAGRRNQRRLAAVQRLRDRARDQDDAIRAWQQSTDAVRAAESEIEDLRALYEAGLAAIGAKRDNAVRRSEERLATLAVLIGDDNNTAKLLGVPLPQVRDALRCASSSRVVEAAGSVAGVQTSGERTLGPDLRA